MLLDYHSEIYAWIRGGLFILFVYHILIFFQNKSKLYLYYSLYLLSFSIYLLKDIVHGGATLFEYLNYSVQFLAFAAYVSFARDLLDSRTHLLKWDKFFESKEVLSTQRNTEYFKQIEAIYLACKAYLTHLNK